MRFYFFAARFLLGASFKFSLPLLELVLPCCLSALDDFSKAFDAFRSLSFSFR
jgi:hypothetical protein